MSIPGLRSFLIVTLLGLLMIFIQGSLLRLWMPETMIAPNLMLAMVAFLAFYEVNAFGVFLSFYLGLLFDLSSGILIGPWAGGFVLVFALLSSLTQRIFTNSPLTAFVAVLVGSLVAQGVYVVMLLQFRAAEAVPLLGTLRLLLEALLSAFCAPLCFAFLKRIRIIPPPRVV